MTIDSKLIVSITETNQNFSKVAKLCEENGSVVIFKNNKPKFVLIDIDAMDVTFAQSDDNLAEAAKEEAEKTNWL